MDYGVYPQPLMKQDNFLGLYPTDFIIENIIDEGIKWFRTTAGAEQEVYGRLAMNSINSRYGQKKINEIAAYIRSVEIRVIQSFPVEDTQMPTISLNLGDSGQVDALQSMNDFARQNDVLGSQGEVVGRDEIGYIPIQDSILIGIHASGTPDKVKYLYYLVTYIICAFGFDKLEEMGFFDNSIRATDMSRFNDMLPMNIFTRFMTLTSKSMPKFKKGAVPIVDSFNINVHT